MTTAHRPTWKAAVGQANEGGWSAGGAVTKQRSALDAPAHTTLKFRREHQVVSDKKAALERSLLALEEAEKGNIKEQIGKRPPLDPAIEERGRQRLLKQTAEVDLEKLRSKYDDADVVLDDGGGGRQDSDVESDLDDPHEDDDGDDSDDDDDDSDDEDDEAALQAELAKIRAEREAARIKQEERAAASERAAAAEAAIHGNPLLNTTTATSTAAAVGGTVPGEGSQLKRRWNDDVVFRNQAKGEPAPKKRFINDTVRNDFHKRFLNKFIR